jgi:hypothetical protein
VTAREEKAEELKTEETVSAPKKVKKSKKAE